ncbi:hypothetical protein IOC57_08295 [Bacillus sp. SD075]|uniref:hypothetical protein n=1 Tax=Bacillus sp. SD075 TaxID=2781732 RepID=UPI001A9784DA|nr:hypothetical protein [Bacillus sp. SD075]MBO0997745.1 hypothetical protein [Bacillus sp. SD075]
MLLTQRGFKTDFLLINRLIKLNTTHFFMFINQVKHGRPLPDDHINQKKATDPLQGHSSKDKSRMFVNILGVFLIWMPMLTKKSLTVAGGR